jgi:hypothetical protein
VKITIRDEHYRYSILVFRLSSETDKEQEAFSDEQLFDKLYEKFKNEKPQIGDRIGNLVATAIQSYEEGWPFYGYQLSQ